MRQLSTRIGAAERNGVSSQDHGGSTPGKRTLVEQIPWPAAQQDMRQAARDPVEIAQQGIDGASHALPYLEQIQRSFGRHDVSTIRAYQGERATHAANLLGARGYAIGSSVAFANAPSLHTAAHEAAHVIQQRGGVQLDSKLGKPGDRYEAHANRVADAVSRGESSEALLDELAPGVGDSGATATPRQAVQLEARDDVALPEGEGSYGSFGDMLEGDRGPKVHHDHGFLDDGHGNIDPARRREPRFADKFKHMQWILKLEGAELVRRDLVDATAAYRHFLFGKGAPRDVHYGRFLTNDPAGRVVLTSAMEDVKVAALHRSDLDAAQQLIPTSRKYHIRTEPMHVATGNSRYPYPATENWQKALGGHTIWIEARVDVSVLPTKLAVAPLATYVSAESSNAGSASYMRHVHVDMTIHAEDMYNFNPGKTDIVTKIPDEANGRFEVSGLAHEYLNRGTFSQAFDFDAPIDTTSKGPQGMAASSLGDASPSGRPEGQRGYPTTR